MFSLTLVLTFAVLYTFYPLIILILNGLPFGIGLRGQQTGGITLVAGGISRMLFTALVMAPVLLLIIFALLRKRVGRP